MNMRVLFVDDQPNVLSGLRRMLRSMRDEWDLEFAESGAQALQTMAKKPFDVVVSDMRMPGMDGVQLLNEVMTRFPNAVRIILSGQAEQASILRAVTPAHLFLTKPCDADTLKRTVSRACTLRSTLSNESLVELVSQVTALPSMPSVFGELLEEIQSQDASIMRIAELISRDVGMVAKLLQMVNSSFFGLPRRVESAAHAASLLGLDVLKPLVLTASVFSQFPPEAMRDFPVKAIEHHSLAVSHLAAECARSVADDDALASDALLAGVVHDVGQLLLASKMPQEYKQAMALARERCVPLCEAERELLGNTHADVGAYLLGLWGLPNSIVEAVAFHHAPGDCESGQFTPLTAVHIANVLSNDMGDDASSVTGSIELDIEYLDRVGVVDRLPAWRQLSYDININAQRSN
ncbi:MAG: response regulator [Pirellulales bacterium]|nr:response regulator [Pirellulales bacterium]